MVTSLRSKWTAGWESGSAYRRRSKTVFRHGYNDQEISTELMIAANADTPIRRYADTFPLPPHFDSASL
jgi:hypothetical protein